MLDKNFDPATAEARLYGLWEAEAAFEARPASDAAPFTIMVPPPNVTGSLHVGHALTFTVQDILIRWRRMQGRDALWQPGTDHAGIATQMVVERLLAAEGTQRRDIGRDAFIDRVWQWKAESGGSISRQLRRLGASLDWERERFTMDDGLSEAVREVFVTLHREGLIYRDRRLVNWDPAFRSAISDLEVESRETRGSMWYLRYPLADDAEGRSIVVATTRPETMLGDTAVAVHPEDARYAALVGREVVLPLTGRRIPIVADTHSDPEKGSGAVKITPAHDFNDFAVGQRHGLAMPIVLDDQARVTLEDLDLVAVPGLADPDFTGNLAGLHRDDARRAIVAELDRLGVLDRVEPHTLQVPHAERGGAVVEPRLTTQWYVDAARLAGPAVAAVESGAARFVPQQWENTFFAWMRDIQPWCISRQLWWGHRIPAWYAPDGTVFVARTKAEAQAAADARFGAGVALVRDEDVLDTWFSSALWPFSTLGWPEKTADLVRYYPTDVLVTGFDIIFFWVARMLMMGTHFMGEVPFRTIYIHGLVRDEQGQKMSKSRGNVIDPLELVDLYGADALRFTVASLTGPGRDVKLGVAAVETQRSFVTKLWNVARFFEMNGVTPPAAGFNPAGVRAPLCRWVLDAADAAIAEATAALEAFRMADYASACTRFTWNTLCDWFVEIAKPGLAQQGAEADELRATAAHVLGVVLRLLHPAMPFVTEELWGGLGFGPAGSLIRAPWPVSSGVADPAASRAELDWVIRCVGAIRAVRAEMNVAAGTKATVLLGDASPSTRARVEAWGETVRRLARLAEFRVLDGEIPAGAAQAVLDEATLAMPLAGLIDLGAERARLEKERGRAAAECQKLERKLGNAGFVAQAKPEVVAETRERMEAARLEEARLAAALQRLG